MRAITKEAHPQLDFVIFPRRLFKSPSPLSPLANTRGRYPFSHTRRRRHRYASDVAYDTTPARSRPLGFGGGEGGFPAALVDCRPPSDPFEVGHREPRPLGFARYSHHDPSCSSVGRRTAVAEQEYGNDPSAGSPTETLLRLLLPLDDQV